MKHYLILVATLLMALVGATNTASAQKVAVKSNLLYLATATPNVGVEVALADRWTLEVAGGYNPWTFNRENNLKAKHWLVSPEVRYWFCESFHGHFIGVNGNYAQFNISGMPIPKLFWEFRSTASTKENFKKARINGWTVGAGITYGYQFILSGRWNLELTAGLGIWYTEYDRFENRNCGMFEQAVRKHAFGPTSVGVSFIYLIK